MERPHNMMQQAGGNVAQGMQRPQSGNRDQQLHAVIMTNLKNKAHTLPSGWQTTFEPRLRAERIMQLYVASTPHPLPRAN